MSTTSAAHYFTIDEYLKLEERAKSKHEYVDGQIFPMCGVKQKHNMIALNITRALHSKLKPTGCRVFMSDMMINVLATNSCYYPDVMVACSALDQESALVKEPRLVVEVLSRGTAATDRREKVIAYKQVPSVREYLIVHQTRPKLELHRKTADCSWILLEYGLTDDLILESLPTSTCLPASVIYEDIEWKKDWTVNEDSLGEGYTDDGEESDPDEDDDNLEW